MGAFDVMMKLREHPRGREYRRQHSRGSQFQTVKVYVLQVRAGRETTEEVCSESCLTAESFIHTAALATGSIRMARRAGM